MIVKIYIGADRLDMFKDESQIRSSRQFQKLQGDDENGLDNLINVS